MNTNPSTPQIIEYFRRNFRKWETEQHQGVKSQADFAKFLHVPAPTLNRWMTGGNPPDEINVERVCRILGDWSLYDAMGWPRPDENIERLKARVETLSPERQAELWKLVEDFFIQNGYRRRE